MSKETWLDTMDEIMDAPEGFLYKPSTIKPVINGLSTEVAVLNNTIEQLEKKNDQWFESYSRQCGETQKWIERVNIIEKSNFFQRLKFLFTKRLDQ
jgi:uncharacterized protein YhaN